MALLKIWRLCRLLVSSLAYQMQVMLGCRDKLVSLLVRLAPKAFEMLSKYWIRGYEVFGLFLRVSDE